MQIGDDDLDRVCDEVIFPALQAAGPGDLCTGDAAAVLDPASSPGVLKGLMSGMMAGHVLIQALAGTATEEAGPIRPRWRRPRRTCSPDSKLASSNPTPAALPWSTTFVKPL